MSLFLTPLKLAAGIVYYLFKLLPTSDKVLLLSRKNSQTSIDFRLLESELAAKHPKTRVVVLNHPLDGPFRAAWRFVEEMYHLATARAVIIDSYLPSVSILRHKKNLKIVQIWHALGAIKKFGRQILDRPEGSSAKLAEAMNMHRNYSYVTVGSRASSAAFSEAFGVREDQVKPVGEPRVDYLLDRTAQAKVKEEVLAAYPALKDKQVILYAPTFRKHDDVAVETLVDAFDSDEYVLLVSQHRLDKTKLTGLPGLVINDKFDVLDLLSAADIVVTDYSAIVFEAAVCAKPIYFYAYDLDKYLAVRGLNVDYEKEMPGPITRSAVELSAAIAANRSKAADVKQFAKKYITVRDGTSAERIVKLLNLGR